MSNFKRKRSNGRREVRRQERKASRQVERQVLAGGKARMPRAKSWSYRPDHPPTIDEGDRESARLRSPRPSAPKPKKDRCPSNPNKRAHEYLRDEPVEDQRSKYGPQLRQDRICVWCGKEETRWKHRWGGWRAWGDQRIDDLYRFIDSLSSSKGR
jgi:hypothetical protein